MRFAVNVAADLYGNKTNLELVFPAFPSLSEFCRQVETTFALESSAVRPPGQIYVPFKLSRLQVYDDRLGQWVELITTNQLKEGAQVYAFQRDTERSETQQQIPPARPPTAASSSVPRSLATAPSVMSSTPAPLTPTSTARAMSPPRPAPVPVVVATPIYGSPAPTAIPVPVPATTPVRTFSDTASMDVKVRTVFDEMDTNRNRVIENDEWRRAFKLWNLDFSTATIGDLFQRADADRDGVVSLGELSNFSNMYPSLLDAMYFRTKEYYEEQRRRLMVTNQQAATEEQRAKERQMQGQHADARRDLELQERNLGLAEQDLQTKMLKERDCRVASGEAKKDVERAQSERLERERDLNGGRDRERQRHAAVVDAQRGVEGTERKLAVSENDVARAQEKERQLEAMLAEAKRESERQLKAMQHIVTELQGWRDREQQALSAYSDAQHEVHRLQDLVAQADLEVARRQEKEREAEAFLAEAQRDASRAAHRRDEEERELQLAREREAHLARLHAEVVRKIDEFERMFRQLEKDLAEYLARRQQVEAQENALIEQEIRLREQRFNLEERETKFRSEAASFVVVAGRTNIGTSPAPVTSYTSVREEVSFRSTGSPTRSPPRRR